MTVIISFVRPAPPERVSGAVLPKEMGWACRRLLWLWKLSLRASDSGITDSAARPTLVVGVPIGGRCGEYKLSTKTDEPQ